MNEQLWFRLGDASSYEAFPEIANVASIMADAHITPAQIRRHGDHGIEAPGFEEANYISLFWGDEDAQPIRPLSDAEIAELRSQIEREATP